MFITRLNSSQQSQLLTLAKEIISADGVVHDREKELLTVLKTQMNPGIEAATVINLNEEFKTPESKASLLLELIGLAHADSEYHVSEKNLIEKVAKDIQIEMETLSKMESWVKRQFALVNEAELFMGV